MAVYMIDYENVKTGGLNGISQLTSADRVIIFYSENANRLTFDLHQRLMASTAKIEYREVSVGGHNALDFQLVTYLGYLIAQDPNGQYLIISNDRGFDYVVNFWKKDGLRIGILSYLKDPTYALQKISQPGNRIPAAEPAELTEADFSETETFVPKETEPEILTAEPVSEETAVVGGEPSEPISLQEHIPVAEVAELLPPEGTVAETTAPIPETSVPKVEVPSTEASVPEEKPVRTAPHKKNRQGDHAGTSRERKPISHKTVQVLPDLRVLLGESVADDPELRFVETSVEKYKTKLGLNNALVKKFGNQKAGEIYQKLKPLLAGKKGC